MADTYTTNLNLTKPEPGAAEDTWGISLNADLDTLDAIFSSTGTQVNLNANQINFADSKIANFGTNNDLRILHNGTNSVFSNYTGNLDFKNFADDSDIRFWSDDGAGGSAVYFKLDGSEGRSVASKDIRFEDGIKSTYGNSDDLQIYHDGSHSYIQDSGSGNLRILVGDLQVRNYGTNENIITSTANAEVALYYNASEKLATTSTGIDVTGVITTDGMTTSADINFGDDDKALFGAGNDLKIYHSANNQSYIHEVGSGDLNILATNLKLQDAGGSTKVLVTSTGIDVTGTVTSDGLTVDGVGSLDNNGLNLELSSSNTGIIYDAQNGYHTFKRNGTNALQINGGTGDVYFYEDTGTSQGFFWDASAESLGIGTTSPASAASLHLKGAGGTELHMESGDGQSTSIIKHNQSANSLEFTPNSNAGKKLEINDTGIDITGTVKASTSLMVGSTDAPARDLEIKTTNPHIRLTDTDASGGYTEIFGGSGITTINADKGQAVAGSALKLSVDATDGLTIDSNHNVDIPNGNLHVSSGTTDTVATFQSTDQFSDIKLQDSGGSSFIRQSNGSLIFEADRDNAASGTGILFKIDNGNVGRFDSSGNLLVGHTAADDTTASASLRSDGRIYSTVSGDQCLSLNRLSSDGEIITFKKDSTIVGNIKSRSGDLIIHTGITGLRFNDGNDAIHPVIVSGSVSDGATDLGLTNAKFKDLYLSGTANVGAINITGTGTSTFGGAITVQGNITTDGGDFKVGTNTVISSARAVDNVVSVTSSGNIQSTGGAFKWNVDGSGFHYLGTDIFDGLLMMSRADETIKFGSGETVSTTDAFQFWTSTTSTSNLGSKVFSITSGGTANFTGSVGIGTSSPDAKLEVSGGALKVTNAGNASIFINANAVGSDASIFFEEDDGVKAKIQHDASNDSMLFTDGAFADTMTLKGAKVGIGTSSPSEALEVTGNIQLSGGADRSIIGPDFRSLNIFSNPNSSTEGIKFSTDGGTTTEVFIQDGGNVGIGTISPSAKLQVTGATLVSDDGTVDFIKQSVSGTTSTLAFGNTEASGGIAKWQYSRSNGNFSGFIGTAAATEFMTIKPNGNVGIGTTAPSEKLHVLGNTKITGNITVGASHTIGDVSAVDDNFLIASADNKDLTIKAGVDSSTLRLKTTNTALTINPEGLVTIEKETTINDDLTINATTPSLNLIDTNNNPDYAVNNANGVFQIFDKTNDVSRLSVTSAGNVGIGTTSPDADLHISSAGGTELHLQEETAGQSAQIKFTNPQNSFVAGSDANPQIFFINTDGNQGSGLCIDTSNNVGIGTSSPAESLHTTGNIRFGDSAPAELYTNSSELRLGVDRNNDNGTSNITFYVNNSESARIDASGRLGIGTTAPETPLHVSTAKSSVTDSVLTLQDTTETFGKMIEFVGQGSTDCRGVIGFQEPQANAPELYIANGGTETAGNGVGLSFWSYITVNRIIPCDNLGNLRDNAIDLGSSSARFDDIYATNGTIQTSDRNQKQDIQALTDAEQRVATACKGLIRRFRWKDAVEEKDDNPDSNETARYHFGVIAQDLQDAFETEGLDAGDYGMFISQTWEDDDGVEQTRLGVRYNELLAFIITTL